MGVLQHHVWPVSVLFDGLIFTGNWYFLSQEHFPSESHFSCQLLGRYRNTCCLTLSKDGQIAGKPLRTAANSVFRFGFSRRHVYERDSGPGVPRHQGPGRLHNDKTSPY